MALWLRQDMKFKNRTLPPAESLGVFSIVDRPKGLHESESEHGVKKNIQKQ